MRVFENILSVKYYLLDINLNDSELLPTHAVVFKKSRNGIDLERELQKALLPETLEMLPKHSNVIASFSGNQVLTRFSSESKDSLFEELDEEEFFLKRMISESGWMIQSACRRSIVNPILELISKKSLFLLDISFSPSTFPILESQIADKAIRYNHFQFDFEQYKLTRIQEISDPETYNDPDERIALGENLFSIEDIDLLSSLLFYLREGPTCLKGLDENASQSKFFRLFRKVGIGTISAVFILLLANFLLFNSLKRNLNQLQASSKSRTEKVKEIEGLKSQLAEYEKLVTSGSYSPQSTYSYYLDMIAEHRPNGVWFNSLEVHPASKKPEINKTIQVDHSLIRITGEVSSPANLNRFIISLNEQKWVSDIELKSYETSTEKPYADFRIDIKKQ